MNDATELKRRGPDDHFRRFRVDCHTCQGAGAGCYACGGTGMKTIEVDEDSPLIDEILADDESPNPHAEAQ